MTRDRERKRTAVEGAGEEPEKPPAFDKALRLLELRPHFARELERKLDRAGYGRDEIAGAVGRLAALGYLDDGAQAKRHAATLAERKGFGAARIRAELARRGAPADAIAAALALSGPDSELERAREAAAKWSRRGARGRDALARHLDRRGFDRRVIFTVLKELGPDPASSEGESFADD